MEPSPRKSQRLSLKKKDAMNSLKTDVNQKRRRSLGQKSFGDTTGTTDFNCTETSKDDNYTVLKDATCLENVSVAIAESTNQPRKSTRLAIRRRFLQSISKASEEEKRAKVLIVESDPQKTIYSVLESISCSETDGDNKDVSPTFNEPTVDEMSSDAEKKKWEAEKCVIIKKVDGNKIMFGHNQTVFVDYTNYVKEVDVPLQMDQDSTDLFPLPPPSEMGCQDPSCRLGCVCSSINVGSVPPAHCRLPNCMLECVCGQKDDDIRTRLRPRVLLFNWRTIKSSDTTAIIGSPQNGTSCSPKTKRRRRRRRKDLFKLDAITRATAALKHLRKQSVVKRGRPRKMNFRRKLTPQQLNKVCRPCHIPVMDLKNTIYPEVPESMEPLLRVPRVVEHIDHDGLLVWHHEESNFFINYTLKSRIPKAVIYNWSADDLQPIPWLYIPVPKLDEIYVFHRISKNLLETRYVYVPELNCVLISKTINMYFRKAEESKKGAALKIHWIGKDSKKREGSLFIFPEIPGLLLFGPIPKDQLHKTGTPRSRKAARICSLIDSMEQERHLGDAKCWDIFYRTKYHPMNVNTFTSYLMNRAVGIIPSYNFDEDVDDDDYIPEDVFMRMIPGFIE